MRRRRLYQLVVAIGVCLSFDVALAVAPRPGLIDSLREAGKLQDFAARWKDAKERGICLPADRDRVATVNCWKRSTPLDYRIPCILVDFSDNPASGGGINSTPEMFEDLLFSTGVNPTGSMKEYYSEVSYGKMNIIGTVVGWFRMPDPYSYYINGVNGWGAYPQNAQRLAEIAIDSAATRLDFSQFDNNSDGWVDGVMIVLPGTGWEETGEPDEIHSHRWSVPNPRFYDGKTIADYTIQPEETYEPGGPLNQIGIYCHEWGHILGLPDLYDVDQCDDPVICGDLLSEGLGEWSLMATGNWLPLYRSYSPAHPDPWCLIQLGFATATNVTANQTDVSIPSVETEPVIYRLWHNGAGGWEYFLVENRDRTGFDSGLPGEGLLIYHIDEAEWGNTNQWIELEDPYGAPHYKVALEQADGFYELERNENRGNGGDPYVADSAGFDHVSYPSSRDYYGNTTQIAVWNISESGDTMTANFDVEFTRPYLQIGAYAIDDPGGDGDGVPEAGEIFELTFELSSLLKSTTDIEVTVSAPGSDLVFVDGTFAVSSIGASGAVINNIYDPIRIRVPDPYRSRTVTFVVETTCEGGLYHWTQEVSFPIGAPIILVVDDDRGGTRDVKMTGALDSLKEVYAIWNVTDKGTPTADTLGDYLVVIWMTGDTNSVSPTPTAVQSIKTYLNGSGSLFLTGQDIAENLTQRPADSAFLHDYLGVTYGGDEQWAIGVGVPGNPVGDGLQFNGGASDGSLNQKSPDRLRRTDGSMADACFTYYLHPDQVAAVNIASDYRAVFFGFGFEAISSIDEHIGFNTRAQILERVLGWLLGGCDCPHQADFDADEFLTAIDLNALIDILFRGDPDTQDLSCPSPRADFDCDGFTTILDLGGLINHLHAGGPGPCDPCGP
jgi:M6 family metalloprotease-like protein